MAIFKCKMCGGDLDVSAGSSVAECEYCGTKQTVSTSRDEVLQNLFNRANNLRIKSEFDKAEQIYEKILNEDDTDAEAHWGIVLCKYGIEYVEDPKTYKRIPTCHRTSYEAVTADPDYLAAVKYADITQKAIYEREARSIDEIQKNILSIVKNEKPFDVFICYKETDENGQRTQDSVIANDIYYQLTQEGLKVFYAAITLEDKLGQAYEPYIFSALSTAKVMLVIGTRPEYFSAVWVKNEWSRFLKLMKTDRSKLLIPCYRNMDAYDLPEEFAHLQAQDMSKIGFINDVVRGINKVINKQEEPVTTVIKETVTASTNTNVAPLLRRAFMFLEDGEFDSADEYCEKVLDVEPENAEAYLGKLMVDLRVKNREALSDCAEPFDNNANYNKIMRFGDDALKEKVKGYTDNIRARNEKAHLDGTYNQALSKMNSAQSEDDYRNASNLFYSIRGYKDSAELAEKCTENAENARKNAILNTARANMFGENISNYKQAITLLGSIYGYKNSAELLDTCKKKIEEIKAKFEEARLEREKRAALARAEHKRKNKIAIAILIGIFVFFVVFGILMKTVIIPSLNYHKAISLMEANEYSEAIALLEKIDGYKDSGEKLSQIRYSSLRSAKIGNTVFWGEYEQDNDIKNGKETIEWIVLDIVEGKAFVVSKYGLECKPYNNYYAYLTWKGSTLRSWLNDDFINNAFSTTEKTYISTTTVKADTNPTYSINPGDDTEDKIFLLSYSEFIRYFSTDDRLCEFTPYASKQGVSSWWLRTNGKTRIYASVVNHSGDLNLYGLVLDSDTCAVRPAMWLDLSSFK